MNTKAFSAKKLLSLMMAITMMITMVLPTNVFAAFIAATNGTISSDIENVTLAVGEPAEFTVSTKANDDAGVKVIGRYEIDSDVAISKMEFYKNDSWVALDKANKGDFGETAGFVFEDAEYKFRVTFAETGTYKFKVSIVAFDGVYGREMCSETDEIKVIEYADFEELKTAIVNAGAYSSDKYTTASYEVLADAVAAGEKAINEKWTKDKQPDVDALVKAINDAIDELVELADYSELTAIYNAGKAYTSTSGKYTAASLKALELALAEAEKDTNKELTVQAEVDKLAKDIEDAIAGLVEVKEVTFTAVAVADDAAVDYAKANKIVLVFAEPIADGSDVLSKLSIADSVENDDWSSDNTVYTLTLKTDHKLKDAAKVVFESDETIMTKLGYALADTEAVVVGNLEEAYEQVTATNMAAKIVKSSDKPGVVAGDKIVLVFNAPVKDVPATIKVNDMTANAVDGTYNTVYEIILSGTESITDDTKLTYGTIADVELNGTFGKAEAPVVLTAVAVDNNGNALTKDDEIVVYFNKPTNGVAIDAKKIVDGAVSAVWNKENTQLTITLGEGVQISGVISINLGNLGIADEYGIADYVAADVELKGAFVVPVAPKVTRILIVDNNGSATVEGDNIIITFDRPTNGIDITAEMLNNISAKVGQGLGTDSTAVWNASATELTITVGKTATLDDSILFDLGSLGIKDEYETIDYEKTILTPVGSFGTSVAPRITRAIAFTQGTKHIIRVFFNTEVVINGAMSVNVDNSFFEGDNAVEKWTDNGITYFDLILGDNHSEFKTGVNSITFNGVLADKETGKISENLTAVITGGFELDIDPEILSLTAYSNYGSGIAKAGDRIVLVMNSKITDLEAPYGFVSTDNVTWTYTLKNDNEIQIGDEIEFEIQALGKDFIRKAVVGGSYGYKVEPKLLSAVAYSVDGSGIAKAGDKIIVTFDSPVDGVQSAVGTVNSADKMTWTITLSDDEIVKIGDELSFNVTAIATGEAYSLKTKLAGSFGYAAEPELLSATVYSNDGSGVAKADDKIVLVFNSQVSDVSSTLGKTSTNDNIVWTITLQNTDVEVGKTLEFNVVSIPTGKAYKTSAVLKGSFGYVAEPKLLSVTAYSNDGSGIAKAGDKIVAVFDMPVEGVTSTLGTVETKDKTVWTITLDDDDTVKINDEIKFNIKSITTGKTYSLVSNLKGSFGYIAEPKLLSVTAYSNDGSGVAKKGDKVVAVFNMPVEGVTSTLGTVETKDKTVWTITLNKDSAVNIADEIKFNITSVATGKAYALASNLKGSFGYAAEPKLLSVTAYSNDGSGIAKTGDKIVAVFNMPVEGVTSELGEVEASADKTIWTITLDKDDSVKTGTDATNMQFSVTSVATGKQYNFSSKLQGNLGMVVEPKLISATAYSKDGSGVAKVGDEIVLVFNTPVEGLEATDFGKGITEDNVIWTITLEKTELNIGQKLDLHVKLTATGKEGPVSAILGGSFGKVIVPEVLSVTAISQDGSGVPKDGDRIVTVFNSNVVVKAVNSKTVHDKEAVSHYTYYLDENDLNNIELNKTEMKFTVVAADGKTYEISNIIGGSFGYEEMPQVKSVILKEEAQKEIIRIVFDQAVGTGSEINLETLQNQNKIGDTSLLGSKANISTEWENDTSLKIILAPDATITNADKLNLAGLGIKSKKSGKEVEGLEALEIQGSLIPVVQKVYASGRDIIVEFSNRTNGGIIGEDNYVNKIIEEQSVFYGDGATSSWSDNNRKLTIKLGEGYSIPKESYIVLNGMEIRDQFTGNYIVVGQYKLDVTNLEQSRMEIVSVFAKTTEIGREDVVNGKAGDEIIIVFADITNGEQGHDATANVELVTDGEKFRENYTATWRDNQTIVITLGENPVITNASQIKIKDVLFANKTGYLGESASDANEVVKTVTGQFDGRSYWITDAAKAAVAGMTRVTAVAKNADITLPANADAYVVCQAYDAEGKVAAINAVKLTGEDKSEIVFDFSNIVASVKLMVLGGDYTDSTAAVGILSETTELK